MVLQVTWGLFGVKYSLRRLYCTVNLKIIQSFSVLQTKAHFFHFSLFIDVVAEIFCSETRNGDVVLFCPFVAELTSRCRLLWSL